MRRLAGEQCTSNRQPLSSQALHFAFLLVAGVFVTLALVGVVRGYSAVPFWDMWDGYLGFFAKVRAGKWDAWWEQHNEHRIVLSRLLFWIDLTAFRGDGRFLLAMNGVLLSIISVVFTRLWREQSSAAAPFVGSFLVAWLWSWMNRDNITWGFQSQFFLAFLLPLVGLCLLARARPGTSGGAAYLVAACATGVLAVGSMASGILVLPAMAAYAALTRQGVNRVVLLGLVGATCCGGFLRDYHSPGHHAMGVAGAGESLTQIALRVLGFELVFLGSPAYHMCRWFSSDTIAMSAAGVAGVCLVLASAWTAWRALREQADGGVPLALMVFNGYVVAAATATALGRAGFGIAGAVTSRYTLPGLMAWAALLVANAAPLTRSGPATVRGLVVLSALSLFTLLPIQLEALRPRHDELFEREVAALALELGVNDERQVRHIWHSSTAALAVADGARASNLSIFGLPPIRDVGSALGKPYGACDRRPLRTAPSQSPTLEWIFEDDQFLRIRGEYQNDRGKPPSKSLVALDAGRLVGLVLIKPTAPPYAPQQCEPRPRVTFAGYILASSMGRPIEFVDAEQCSGFSVELPAVRRWFTICDDAQPTMTTVPTTAVVPLENRWSGSDFDRSRVPGMTVLGSYRTGDADTGTVRLRVRRGDRIAYRSGPVAERQSIAIVGDPASFARLPRADHWTLIAFEVATLPDAFEVELADRGAGWGEWSAVLLAEPVSGQSGDRSHQQ